MEELLSMTVIGIIATSGMISFLWLITGLTKTNVDMVKAVGSIYSKSEETALTPGLLMQFTSGIIMTYIYGVFFSLLHLTTSYSYALIALLFGLIHGLAVTIVLKHLIAEHHPLEKFQEVNFKKSLAHILAHILFGLIIGVMYGSYLS